MRDLTKKLSRFIFRASPSEGEEPQPQAHQALLGSSEHYEGRAFTSPEQTDTFQPGSGGEPVQPSDIIWRGTINHDNQEVFSILLTLSGSGESIEGTLQAIDPVQGNTVELGLVAGSLLPGNVLTLTSNTELEIVATIEDGAALGTITFPESWGTAALVADIAMINDNRWYNPVVIR